MTPRRSWTTPMLATGAVVLGATCALVGCVNSPRSHPTGTAPSTTRQVSTASTLAAAMSSALPAPTGSDQVGEVSLHLVDRSRANPWAASPAHRELMVSVFYPATDTARYPLASQIPAGISADWDKVAASELDIPQGKVDWAATRTAAHEGAPAARGGRPRPVVLYSPGAGDVRGWQTTLVQDLASRGFIVVTIDHPYESAGVEFPDGKVVPTMMPALMAASHGDVTALLRKITAVRVADVKSVLDALQALNAGHNPDAEHRALPRGLAGDLDTGRIGMFGQSAGGITAAEAMYEDPRIHAGIDMDGILEYAGDPTPGAPLMPVAEHGLNRPFLLMGSQSPDGESLTSDPSWRSFYEHSTGWHRDVTLLGSRHASYTDAESLLPRIAERLGLPRDVVVDDIGTLDPNRAVAVEETYVATFFDRWLRGGTGTLLNGPSPRYPEVSFVG